MVDRCDTVLSPAEVRSIAVNSQRFASVSSRNVIAENVLEISNHIGYVQIDTISVVRRAHHHVLWSRNHLYTEAVLDEVFMKNHELFEYWTHAMSYVPMQDYRFFLPRMKNFQSARHPWFKALESRAKPIIDEVFNRIKDEGPLGTRDFEDTRNKKREGWWDWKPAKDALEVLFWRGDLMVSGRDKFQKIYDITERVVPAHINTTFPGPIETAKFLVQKALKAHGILSLKDFQAFMQPDAGRDSDMRACGREYIQQAVNELRDENTIVKAQISGSDEVYYVQQETLNTLVDQRLMKGKTRVLSPFDNLVINRDRLERLLGFRYMIECYTPAPKRKYGYFSLPILYQNTFIGRADMKADKMANQLEILNCHFEDGCKLSATMAESIIKEFSAFARFNNCNKVRLKKSNRTNWMPEVITLR